MLKDIPYSVLKQDSRAYEIMLLRDQYANTFFDIAAEYEISVARVKQIYNRLKTKQACLYINHIAVVLQYKGTSQIREFFNAAYEWYQELSYSCAYLEKKYQDILTEYRDGEPGYPTPFIKSMPPFKSKLSKKTIARVVEMRELEKASYVRIAKELRMTRAKARHTYDMFYHKQVLVLIKDLQEKAENHQEKTAIWNFWFSQNKCPKNLFDMLIKQTGEHKTADFLTNYS